MRARSVIIFFLCLQFAMGQDKKDISLEVENASLQEIFSQLEQKTTYRFYYAVEWLDDKKYTKSYIKVSLDSILEDLLKDSLSNFFVTADNRVIITKNNSIYGALPEDFFGRKHDTILLDPVEFSTTVNPVLIQKLDSHQDNAVLETIRIGKENKGSTQKRFQLKGHVKDSETGKPIPNLAVVVKEHNIGANTNEEGYYEIEIPIGLNVLETSSLGYKNSKRNVIIYNNGALDIVVDENYEELDEVIVNANAIKNVEDANTGSTTIGSEASKNIPLVLGERDVLKVATTLPGVSTAGEGASGFNVRGGKTDQNLILLDNAVIYNPSHFFGIFQALNPFAIKDVTIYKGSIPAEFGGRLSSVFEIVTKNANTEKLSGEASIGPVTTNAIIEIPIIKNKAGLMIGGRAAYSDWVLRSLKNVSLRNSTAQFYDAMVKYNHQINSNNGLSLSGYYSNDAFSITSDSLYGYSNRLFSLKWDHKFNDKNTGSLIAANSTYKFDIDYDGTADDSFIQRFQIEETEVKMKFNYAMNETHNFDYGLSGKFYGVLPGQIRPKNPQDIIQPFAIPKEQGLEAALFLTDNFKVNDNLLIDVGLRYSFFAALGKSKQRVYEEGVPKSENTILDTLVFDKNKVVKNYGGPEVRVSARYFLGKDFSVKVGYNNTYQYIHTLSNNTTVSPIDTWKLSDYNIKPQQADQFSMGLFKNLSGNDYEISLEGFYKKQKNLLDFKTGAKLLLNETIETEVLQGNGKAYGVELLIKKNVGRLNGWFGYTYSRSFLQLKSDFREEEVNDGRFFPSNFDKPHDFSVVLNYKLTRRFSLSGNFIYQTGRPVTFPVGNYSFNGSEYVLYSDRNQFRIPDYYRLDLGLNIEGNHKIKKFAHSFWTISVYNVLGRNNPYSVFFVSNNGQIKALQSSIFAVPIPSITYNFKF